MKNQNIYIGCRLAVEPELGQERFIFFSDTEPTRETHGERFIAVIGPFETMDGAIFMKRYGQGNPHCQCVEDAERLGRKYANSLVHRAAPGPDRAKIRARSFPGMAKAMATQWGNL